VTRTSFSSSTELVNEKSITGQISSNYTQEISVTFVVYVMCFTSFIGNWLFVLFAGVGLFALPLDLVLEFVNRPVLRKSSEAMKIKNLLKS